MPTEEALQDPYYAHKKLGNGNYYDGVRDAGGLMRNSIDSITDEFIKANPNAKKKHIKAFKALAEQIKEGCSEDKLIAQSHPPYDV